MAYMTCHYFSSTLGSNITLNVIIPTPTGNEQIVDTKVQEQYNYAKGLPVVYLTHGAYGDCDSWIRFSNIDRYAQENCCAVVMVSTGNNFYQDMYHGLKYRTFITEELPAFITSVFPVSKRREDTFIAGFSMGGYGAWYLALSTPNMFAKAASMSGALDIVSTYEDGKAGRMDSPFAWSDIFENPDELKGSDKDLFALYEKCKADGVIPELYQACGTEDFLYKMNVDVHDRLTKMGAEISYHEGPGGHNWDFWDAYIRDILKWFLNK